MKQLDRELHTDLSKAYIRKSPVPSKKDNPFAIDTSYLEINTNLATIIMPYLSPTYLSLLTKTQQKRDVFLNNETRTILSERLILFSARGTFLQTSCSKRESNGHWLLNILPRF